MIKLRLHGMERFQILKWDSDFFGMPVAQILPDNLSVEDLDLVISQMKMKKIKLAYWASNPNDEESQKGALLFHGFLADKKVTFVMDISRIGNQPERDDRIIEEYTDKVTCTDLENLAVQAGIYSRFKRDVQIPERKFVELYRLWMRNSVSGQMADAVMVARYSGKIAGMVTALEKNGRGNIGLLAIYEDMRGKNIGAELVGAAQRWAYKRRLTYAQVVTQEDNIPSCNLYKKCGYHIDKIEYFYHFWI